MQSPTFSHPHSGRFAGFTVEPGWNRTRVIKLGWYTPDHHLTSFDILIRMNCAGLHGENFTILFPWFLCSAFHLSPYKNPCLHWYVEMGFGQDSPSHVIGTWIKYSFPPLSVLQIGLLWHHAAEPWFWLESQWAWQLYTWVFPEHFPEYYGHLVLST